MKAPTPALAIGALAAATLVAAGSGLALVLRTSSTPPALEQPVALGSVPVVAQPFADERPVEVAVGAARETPVSTSAAGRVTAASCEVGEPLVSGRVLLAVDGRSILGLATDVPLWRDLRPGDRGDDVVALQRELARLGAPLRADGVLGEGSVAEVHRLLGDPGRPGEQIGLDRLLWLPGPSAVAGECTAVLGSPLAPDEPVAVVTSPPTVRLLDLPEDALPGPRVLRLDGLEVALSEEEAAGGPIGDAEAIGRLTATAAYRAAVADGDEAPELSAVAALAEPAVVAAVPPGALYGQSGAEACVEEHGRGVPVSVVGSQLGQSYVVVGPDRQLPERVASDPGPTAPACR